ncbi:hypothetical protein [Paenibacillus sp. SN-8-1]|uniref:hypothetical protein n=1 Tax=Paenibacillus sp. SN-8-1 TaxID=3435409 RepID=UPI003D9AA820
MGKKEEKKVQATELKPIRSTHIHFKNNSEEIEFINYATSNQKTDDSALNRLRQELFFHKRSPRRK